MTVIVQRLGRVVFRLHHRKRKAAAVLFVGLLEVEGNCVAWQLRQTGKKVRLVLDLLCSPDDAELSSRKIRPGGRGGEVI